MATVLTAYDAAGAPLEGLSPTWRAWINAETGEAAEEPSRTPLGNGEYAIGDRPGNECGILDFGAGAVPRLVLVQPTTVTVIAAFDAAGEPKDSPAPAWETYRKDGEDFTPQATFAPLGTGMFRLDGLTDGATGRVFLGTSARPQRLEIGDELATGEGGPADTTAPVVTFVSPVPPAEIGRYTPFVIDITDLGGLGFFEMKILFEATGALEVAYDPRGFTAAYVGSEIAAIENGWRITLRRRDGWRSSPTPQVEAIDTSGNQVAP